MMFGFLNACLLTYSYFHTHFAEPIDVNSYLLSSVARYGALGHVPLFE